MEYNVRVEVSELTGARLDDVDDLLDALEADPRLLGPSLAVDLHTGTVSVLADVSASSHSSALGIACTRVLLALEATGRGGGRLRSGIHTEPGA